MAIGPDDLGKRVVVRYRNAHAQRDVLGILLNVDDASLTVLPDETPERRIETGDIVAAKPVPPKKVTTSSSPSALQRLAIDGWQPTHRARLGGWVLRASDGWTRRANSVLAVGDTGTTPEDALAYAQDFYTKHDLPLVLCLPYRTDVHAATEADRSAMQFGGYLEQRGYQRSSESVFMTRKFDRNLQEGVKPPNGYRIHLSRDPNQPWLDAARIGDDPFSPTALKILCGTDNRAFVSVRHNGTTVATGRATFVGQWLGITSLNSHHEYRNLGLGASVLTAALLHGLRLSAKFAYLQVAADNHSALTLVDRFGFVEHHRYCYFTAP